MGLIARLLGREPKQPPVVNWLDHPWTKELARHLERMLFLAKEMKRKRERLGRSADYWQGRIDMCEELKYDAKHAWWPYTKVPKCYRGWCPVCGAAEDQECDLEKHNGLVV